MNLLLLGPQGAGKGTQAKRIAAGWDIPHVSTGDMFRALDESTPLGREVSEIMARGELVPDEITIRMIEDRLSQDDAVDGFILDGFPRNQAQAQALDSMLSAIGRGLDAILFFDVPDDVALERMAQRSEQEGRADDNPEAMRKRLAIYHDETVPVVEHYRTTGKLVPLHAGRPVDDVFAEIQSALATVGTR
jgi:adenylate kinase